MTAPSWRDRAACFGHDPELWFPADVPAQTEAKRICSACPVTAECAAHAIQHDERFGVWGGLTEVDRMRAGQTRF